MSSLHAREGDGVLFSFVSQCKPLVCQCFFQDGRVLVRVVNAAYDDVMISMDKVG